MALTVTWNGYGKVSDIDNLTNISVIKATSGGGTPSAALADGGIQGATSPQAVTVQSSNKLIILYYDLGSGNELGFNRISTSQTIQVSSDNSYAVVNDNVIAQSFQTTNTTIPFMGGRHNSWNFNDKRGMVRFTLTKDVSGSPSLEPEDIILTEDIPAGFRREQSSAEYFYFKEEVYLEASTTYWLVWQMLHPLEVNEATADNYLNVPYLATGTYVDGQAKTSTDGGATWTSQTWDVKFQLIFGNAEGSQNIYAWGNFLAPSLLTDRDTEFGGFGMIVGEDNGGSVDWNLYSFYDSNNYAGGWVRMAINPYDVESNGDGLGSTRFGGAAGLTLIRYIGVYAETGATAKFDNLLLDRIDVGYGYTVSGTSDDMFADLLAIEEESANQYGVIERVNADGSIISLNGQLVIGDSASDDIKIKDQVIIIDNKDVVARTSGTNTTWYQNQVIPAINYQRKHYSIKITGGGKVTVGTKTGTGNDASGISGLTLVSPQEDYPIVTHALAPTPTTALAIDSSTDAVFFIICSSWFRGQEITSIDTLWQVSGSPDYDIEIEIRNQGIDAEGPIPDGDVLYSATISDGEITATTAPYTIISKTLTKGSDTKRTDMLFVLFRPINITTIGVSDRYAIFKTQGAYNFHTYTPTPFGTTATYPTWPTFSDNTTQGIWTRIYTDKVTAGIVADAAETKIYGASFTNVATVKTVADGTNDEFHGNTLSNCGPLEIGDVTSRNCSIINYDGVAGGLRWNDNIDIQGYQFINNTKAIEHDSPGTFGYTGLTFSGNTDDINNSADYDDSAATTEDSYLTVNSGLSIGGGQAYQAVGQIFQMTNTTKVTAVVLYMGPQTSTPTTNEDLDISIYNITGTPGTNATPTGAALHTETFSGDTDVNLQEAYTLVISGQSPILTAGTWYAIEVKYQDAGTSILVGDHNASPTHPGNWFRWSSGTGYQVDATHDLYFAIKSGGMVEINATDSNPATSIETGNSQTTINNSVNVTITVIDVDKSPIENAQVSVHLNPDDAGSEVMNKDTNASGVAQEAYNYAGDVDAIIKVRKSETADNPKYIAFSDTQTITNSGLTLEVTLQEK